MRFFTKSTITLALFLISSSSLYASSRLEQIAEEMDKMLPIASPGGFAEYSVEFYKSEAQGDTLISYFRIMGKQSEMDVLPNAQSVLRETVRFGYCSLPYETYQKYDYKWKSVYVDIFYNQIFSVKVSRRDC